MEQVREKQFYDSWRQAERALKRDRDPRQQVSLPKVTIQAGGVAPPQEEELHAR